MSYCEICEEHISGYYYNIEESPTGAYRECGEDINICTCLDSHCFFYVGESFYDNYLRANWATEIFSVGPELNNSVSTIHDFGCVMTEIDPINKADGRLGFMRNFNNYNKKSLNHSFLKSGII